MIDIKITQKKLKNEIIGRSIIDPYKYFVLCLDTCFDSCFDTCFYNQTSNQH